MIGGHVLFNLESGMKPVSAVGAEVAKRLGLAVKGRRVRRDAEALPGARFDERLLAASHPARADELTRYVTSPDFDHVCFEYAVHRRTNWGKGHRHTEEMQSSVRRQLLEGLRHFTGFDAADRTQLADILYREIVSSAAEVVFTSTTVPDETDVAVAAHATAAGVRNGALLARVTDIQEIHTFARNMREQVRNLRGEMPLPHIRGAQKVPYDQLWVKPRYSRSPDSRSTGGHDRQLFEGRTVLLGAPGAGKSTMAEKIAFDIAHQDHEDKGVVPFLVTLRNFVDDFRQTGRTLDDYLVLQCADPYGLKPPPEAIPYLLQNGRAVVILDGLDELTRISMRRRVVELIEGFAHRYPDTSILVTSRKVGYDYAPLTPRLFQLWDLEPFKDDQVRQYAYHWFRLDAAQNRVAGDPDGREKSANFLRESESIQDIRSNPLMLSLLCGIYLAEHFIPSNRADVYRSCAELLFWRWDAIREIVDHEQNVLNARTALRYIAWFMFSETSDGRVNERLLIARLHALFAQRSDEDIAAAKARAFVEICAGRSWVLAEVGATAAEHIYAFVHRSFLEYFTAEYLATEAGSAEELHRAIGDRIAQGEWPEVAHLAAQLHVANNTGSEMELARLLLAGGDASRCNEYTLHFLSQMLSYTAFSPALLRSLVDAAVRMALGVLREDATDTSTRMNPLHAVLTESSPGNLEMVRRAVRESLARGIAEHPFEVLVLATASVPQLLEDASAGRRKYWAAVFSDVIGELSRLDIAHDRHDLRAVIRWQAQRDARAASALLTTERTADLYRPLRLSRVTFASPAAGLLSRDDVDGPGTAIFTVSLMEIRTPWIDTLSPLVFESLLPKVITWPWPALPPNEFAARTLLALPVLEWALLAGNPRIQLRPEFQPDVGRNDLDAVRGLDLVRARQGTIEDEAVVQLARDRGCGEKFVEFLVGWMSGRISTLDADRAITIPLPRQGSGQAGEDLVTRPAHRAP